MDYRGLTYKELYKIAKAKGVPKYYIYRKHILIKILEKVQEQ